MDKKIEYFFGELHLIGNFLIFLMSLSTIILVSITLYNIGVNGLIKSLSTLLSMVAVITCFYWFNNIPATKHNKLFYSHLQIGFIGLVFFIIAFTILPKIIMVLV